MANAVPSSSLSTPRGRGSVVVVATASHALARARDVADVMGARLVTVSRPGTLATGRAISDTHPRLVVVGPTHGLGRPLAERLLGQVRCPVLQVQARTMRSYEHVVVATALGSAPGVMTAAARLVAPHVPLTYLHVFAAPLERTLTLYGAPDDVVKVRRAREAAEREERVRAALTRMGLQGWKLEVEHGVPSVVLARVSPRALLVLDRSRSWLKHALFGSVTRAVLENAACDVLVVDRRLESAAARLS